MSRAHDVLYHITTHEAWAAARQVGSHAPPSLLAEGFVHLSTADQVIGTANRVYAQSKGLVVLVVDGAQITHDLRWEAGAPGEQYPHLYRALLCSEVVALATLVASGSQWVRLEEEPRSR